MKALVKRLFIGGGALLAFRASGFVARAGVTKFNGFNCGALNFLPNDMGAYSRIRPGLGHKSPEAALFVPNSTAPIAGPRLKRGARGSKLNSAMP
jgi:hypothetical protein